MNNAKSAIQQQLRMEGQTPDEVTVPEMLGQVGHYDVIDGPDDVRDALESLQHTDDTTDEGDTDTAQAEANDTIQTLAEADQDSFEETIAVLEDVELLRDYATYEVKTQTRQERIAVTNQRIDEIKDTDE